MFVTGSGSGYRVLRIERQHDQFVDAGITQQAQHRVKGWIAVAHRELNMRLFKQLLL